MGILDFLRRAREEAKEGEAKRADLRRLRDERASDPESRIALYEPSLRALLGVDDGFVIFQCDERKECYVQFARVEVPGRLWGEVAGKPLSAAGGFMLEGEGFKPPDDKDMNYHREFEGPEPRALAELVEAAFVKALDLPLSYTVEVAEVEAV
jgi:hypothetical protein